MGSTLHGLQNNDNVELELLSTQTKGVGAGATSVVVKYSAQNDKLLINPTIFTNSAINTIQLILQIMDSKQVKNYSMMGLQQQV